MNLDRYKVIPLADILQSPDGEKTFHDTTNELSCPLNPAVEHFLISTALTNQKIGISRTNLVVLPKDMHQQLVGYYSLALQVLDLDRITSKSLRKKITGFKRENKLGAAVYLIAIGLAIEYLFQVSILRQASRSGYGTGGTVSTLA